MSDPIVPLKLSKGDEVRIIAPALSAAIFTEGHLSACVDALTGVGLKVSFGEHVRSRDCFDSSSVEDRLEDLHRAFSDPRIRGVLSVTGGFNSVQILEGLDMDLIRANPRVLCGYSDITTLSSAIQARTGLITYNGPHFTMFGFKSGRDYLIDNFARCVMTQGPYVPAQAERYVDHPWRDQDSSSSLRESSGWRVVRAGACSGRVVGGNLSSLCLLLGSPFMPSLNDAVLFIEEDEDVGPRMFDRYLESVLLHDSASGLRGVVVGRFQDQSKMGEDELRAILLSKRKLEKLPIAANVDFGHTYPHITIPIGGVCDLSAEGSQVQLTFTLH